MGFVLGFGSTETQVRKDVRDAMLSGLSEGKSADEILKKWNDQADIFDKQPRGVAPERYTRIWFYGGQLHFHHINREHALSPDGWALFGIDEDFGGTSCASPGADKPSAHNGQSPADAK